MEATRMTDVSTGHHPGSGGYEIRVKGRLAPGWRAWFDGMTLTTEAGGITCIHGPVADQAALHGLLQKLRDVGIPLISLKPVEAPTTEGHAPHHERN
jgi:hypothetical protein